MFGLDNLFDFNRNRKMDTLENASMHASLYDLTNENRKRKRNFPYSKVYTKYQTSIST